MQADENLFTINFIKGATWIFIFMMAFCMMCVPCACQQTNSVLPGNEH